MFCLLTTVNLVLPHSVYEGLAFNQFSMKQTFAFACSKLTWKVCKGV